MIKIENYGKITENYRNLPENSLKICRRAKLGGWGVRLSRTGGFLPIFSMTGGFWPTPPLAMSDPKDKDLS